MADRDLRLRILMDAADRVSRPLRDITGGSRRAAEALRDTRQALRGINDQQAQITAFRTLRGDLGRAEQAMRTAQARATALGRDIAQTANPTRAMSRAFEQARRDAAQLEAQHVSQTRQMQDLRRSLREAGIDTRDLARHERELRDRARDTSRAIEDQSRALERASARQQRMGQARDRFNRTMGTAQNAAGAGMGMVGTAVAAAAPLVASAKIAMDLEEGMAGVAKVTGMARGQLLQMQNGIVELSTSIPMTSVELSQIAAAAGAAGVGVDAFGKALPSQRDDILAFTRDAAQMGIAFDMTAEDAGQTMAKWRTAFKMTQPDVVALGDRVNALTNRFGGNAAAVTDIITRVGPLGDVAGLAAPQMAALGHYMNRVGVESDVAATGIKNTLLALVKGKSATKAQSAAFKSLGLDAERVAKSMQVDASGTIIDVLERIKGLSKDQQASTLGELFGTESLGAIAPLLSNLDAVKTELRLVGDAQQYAGSMGAEFASRIATTTGMTERAKNAFTAAGLGLGATLLPTIQRTALHFAAAALRVRAFTLRHPDLTRNLMMTAGAMALLLGAAGMLTIGYAALMGPMALFGALSTATGVGLLPIIGIVLAVVAAVALLGYGAYQLYQHWDGIAAWFGGIWNAVRGFFVTNWTAIRNLLLGAVVIFMPPVAAMMWLVSVIYRNWDRIRAGFNAGVAYLAGIAQPIVQPIVGILTAIGGLAGRFAQLGLHLIQGLGRGILSGVGWVLRLITNVASTLGAAFAKAMGIKSPSRVFMAYGGHLMSGLHNGIDADAASPVRRMTRLSRDLTDAMDAGAKTPTLAVRGSVPGATGYPGVAPRAAANGGANSYHISITAPGGDTEAIKRAVREAIDDAEREKAAQGRSQFTDTPDWGD